MQEQESARTLLPTSFLSCNPLREREREALTGTFYVYSEIFWWMYLKEIIYVFDMTLYYFQGLCCPFP